MEKINIARLGLITTLEENLSLHKKVYAEAMVAFKRKLLRRIEEIKTKAEADDFDLSIGLEKPVDHSHDYKNSLEMVKRDARDIVVISEDEFLKCVLNKWDWVRSFRHSYISNVTGYSGSTGPTGISGYSGWSPEAKKYFGEDDD